jgi:hypothetical protein
MNKIDGGKNQQSEIVHKISNLKKSNSTVAYDNKLVLIAGNVQGFP